MKKYCLTTCFKRKMNKGWDNLLQFIIVILVAILILVAIVIVSYGIGWLAVYFGMELPERMNYPGFGSWLTVMFAAFIMVLYWIYITIKKISKKTYSFAKERYEGIPYKCSIFEECKEEQENE